MKTRDVLYILRRISLFFERLICYFMRKVIKKIAQRTTWSKKMLKYLFYDLLLYIIVLNIHLADISFR